MRTIYADKLINEIVFHTNLPTDIKEEIEDIIQNAPPVEPERGHGEWVLGGYDDMYYVCNKCGHKQSEYYSKPTANFCPNCGVDMREKQNENN